MLITRALKIKSKKHRYKNKIWELQNTLLTYLPVFREHNMGQDNEDIYRLKFFTRILKQFENEKLDKPWSNQSHHLSSLSIKNEQLFLIIARKGCCKLSHYI